MSNTKGTSVISSPSGGGAQSGMGEKFSPDLFTGTGNFSVPIAVPPGRNGFQPELSLGYSSGNGNGIFGMGWAMGIPGITRKTSKGIPLYEDRSDIFILSGAEDLVPVSVENEIVGTAPNQISWERTFYRPRTEGLFARIIRHKKTNGEHYWEVRSKDGLISYYGTPGSSSNDPCVTANPEKRDSIYAWHLSKTQDPFGNVIVYEYDRDLKVATTLEGANSRRYDQLYPLVIKYAQYQTGTAPNIVTKYLCEVRFNYEERPDPFSAYKQGFEMRTVKRCTSIETYTNAASLIKTKIYHFNYLSNLLLNGASMLQSVSVEGIPSTGSGELSEFMPPLEFSYSKFNPAKRELKQITGPLPPVFLSEPGYELVDLTGNGLPDLLQLNGTARYWTNKGNGEFSNPRNMNISPSVQLGMPGVQMIDANGDGRNDLMVNDGTHAGYFPGAFHSVWDSNSFRPYKQIPSFSFADPEVQLIDLDGDGVTDVLRNGKRFECFYNHPEKGFHKVKTADKKFTDFSFSDPRVRFADMTGDGLQDIVFISSGRVQYWPNMGYGRFGNKINMKNAPRFPEQYNPAQILLGDLDGDGQADIAFVENNSVTLYINQSGNGFSEPTKILNTPVVRDPKAIRLIDIMGTGQAGILWTMGGGSSAAGKMYFLDFTKGNKPYVMEEMNNNMGSITRVKYGSSIYHYLRDEKKPETRWKTDLPFSVQVVNKVEVLDLLSGGKLVTEYKYHNGYWDGVEREFRGFAHVDSFDTETFDQYNLQDLFSGNTVAESFETVAEAPEATGGVNTSPYNINTVSSQHYTPPTMTKSWFYVGPVGDGFSRWQEPDFSNEYWSGDVNVLSRPLDMTTLLTALPRRARRDALRTLRGSLLRSELYALDNSALKDKPYTVTESLMSVRKEFDPYQLPNPLWLESSGYSSGGGYIFFPFNVAQRTSQYERGNDPMHSFSFTKTYDAYGQAIGQLSVAVPRGLSVPGMPQYSGPFTGATGDYLATYNVSDYIHKDLSAGIYMVNRVKRSISYDATKSSQGRNVFELRDEIFAEPPPSLPVIGCTLNYYDGSAFAGLAYGLIGDYGAQVRSETLIITTAILDAAYGSGAHPQCFQSSPTWTVGNGYPANFAGAMQDTSGRMGYKDRRSAYPDHIPGWYAESARIKYDFHVSPSTAVGLTLESKDTFDALSDISYDTYKLMPLSSKQYLASGYLETIAEYDYRVMQPSKVTDPNLNITVFDFSPLGLLRATALIGKGTEGDYKSSSGDFYAKYEPSVRMAYDFFAFKNSGDPVWVKTTSLEKHYQQSASSPTIEKVEYSDGFGRLLQTRVQAEDVIFGQVASSPSATLGHSGLPADQSATNVAAVGIQRSGGDPLNVVVSGWKIYNNKGKVVEQYEPFFDQGFDFVASDAKGVKVRMFYDPLGRVIKTLNPDGSMQMVVYGIPTALNTVTLSGVEAIPSPWINYSYDANDLSPISHPTGNPVPAAHWYTPKSALVDALGRTIKTTEHKAHFNGTVYEDVVMQYRYDIRGNLLTVSDPLQRLVFSHVYDLRPAQKGEDGKAQPLPPLKTIHIDKGTSSVLFDAAGKPIESSDAKGAKALSGYDVISRPLYSWAKNKTADAITLRNKMVYGEGVASAAASNLMGKVYENFDEAGKLEFPTYDFKGNVITKTRKVIDETVLQSSLNSYTTYIINWDSPPTLATMVFTSDMAYDALNRITKLTLPLDVSAERKKIIPSYNTAGALEQVKLSNNAETSSTTYVENIAYNAKGQRLLIAFGNNVMSRYAYDPLSFRLLRQRSEAYSKTTVGNTITYAYTASTLRQDDGFNFDLAGNIVKILDRMKDCGIGGTPDALNRNFNYDPLYRLTFADGRESNSQNVNAYLYADAPVPSGLTDVRTYSRTYSYDKLGNVQKVIQAGTNGFTRDFRYNANVNTLEKVVDGSATLIENFTYDANGNQLTAGTTRNYKWNHSDQLICYYNQAGGGNPSVFTQYDYAGQDRVSKLVKTGTIFERIIYIDGIFEYVKLFNRGLFEKNYIHIMDDKSRIAEVRVNGANLFQGDLVEDVTYLLENQIGSSVMRLKSTGLEIDREEYYPFGDSSLRTFTYKRYRYVGKERDAESGLYYYGARYYAAWTCRFISVDALAGDYMYLSPYNYAANNPINDYDIDGNQNTTSTPDSTTTNQTNSDSTNVNQPDSLNTPETAVKLEEIVIYANKSPDKQSSETSSKSKRSANSNNIKPVAMLSFLKFNTAEPDKTRVNKGLAPNLSKKKNSPRSDPFKGKVGVSSGWLRNNGDKHGAFDYGVPVGTPIESPAPGKVVTASMSSSGHMKENYGNYVLINHGVINSGENEGKALYSLYGHLSSIDVEVGQNVKTGDLLGNSGHTGSSTGPHLHWEIIVSKNSAEISNGTNKKGQSNFPNMSKTLIVPSEFLNLFNLVKQPQSNPIKQ